MSGELYTQDNSTYLKHNPDWHVSDSPWKAAQILKMIKKHDLKLRKIAEVGCGAGEILNQLHASLNEEVSFYGYEIAPDAFELCKTREKPRLHYSNENPFEGNTDFDLLIAADVFEHVEDSYSFIRNCTGTATYKIFHIPLEMSAISVLRNMPIKAYQSVGHLHFYTKDTALALLKNCGHTVIDYSYTAAALEAPNRQLRTKIINLPRRVLYRMNKDFCVRLLGGFSLLVLTK